MQKEKIKVWLFNHRHPILLVGLLMFFILPELFEQVFYIRLSFPIQITILILASVLIIQTSPKKELLTYGLVVILLVFLFVWNRENQSHEVEMAGFVALFIYFSFITFFLFKDLIRSKEVTGSVVIGAFAGYFMIGVIAFFIYSFLENAYPETLNIDFESEGGMDDTFYFSFITLTTIGYGDFAPTSSLGQKIAILEGLIGQFYLAIVMAILVGKFLSRKSEG